MTQKRLILAALSNPSPPIRCTDGVGDFYTLNFSDNQGLSLDVQGGELAAIIKMILDTIAKPQKFF
jgi:hypothetical protein